MYNMDVCDLFSLVTNNLGVAVTVCRIPAKFHLFLGGHGAPASSRYCCGRNKAAKCSVESSAMLPKLRVGLFSQLGLLMYRQDAVMTPNPLSPLCKIGALACVWALRDSDWIQKDLISIELIVAVPLGCEGLGQFYKALVWLSDLNASHSKGAKVKAWCSLFGVFAVFGVFSVFWVVGGVFGVFELVQKIYVLWAIGAVAVIAMKWLKPSF